MSTSKSRLYYNTTDGKCRDDYYLGNSSVQINTRSLTPPTQLQAPTQEHYHQLQNSQQHHFQQTLPHNHHQLSHIPQNTQHFCSSSSVMHPIDDSINCEGFSNITGRVVAATQTQQSNINTECDQMLPQSPEPIGPVNIPAPPLMYTVHRVVTTAQIQTAVGSTFASSASVSSVLNAGRNENDCLSSGQVTSAISIPGNGLSDISNNVINNNNVIDTLVGVRSSTGILANTSFLQKRNNGDIHQNSVTSNRIFVANASTSANSGKISSLMARTMQNVIPTCVYLMSRVAVHMEIEGTAQCPSQVMLAAALGCEELGISNKLLAQSIFGLWMTSTLLEMQLKAHHCPYAVRVVWKDLIEKFSCGNPIDRKYDEPMIVLKRNVFFSKRDEEKIKDHRILELLYEEAKNNVLIGRYIMEPVHALMLGGIQARIELGPYNSHTHTIGFFREHQSRFLPSHVAKSSNWLWLPVSRKNSAEVKLLEQFKRVPHTATTRKLIRKYLEFCWALPFYGAAYFHGQLEQPISGIMSLVNHKDIDILIAINERGVFIIDLYEYTLLLGLRYEDLSWDYAKPSAGDDSECLTCIFIQFDAIENGIQISKLVQIFSKQAAMIDALISHFTDQINKRNLDENSQEQFHDEPNPIQSNGNGVLCNKLSRLTLATFDEEGRCIGQMGSLSISY
ncbi:putative FERM domain-containing protein FRMD8P1 isoform X2 [Scaptodrosophila lebanonensis]|uniref:FERM domain-containing protein 8 n=1 Tax=Drosophila lebanonensis TaxID=7225 RepID=A0A6J2TWF7_DROLE|nr:putative FERM domain-containing protein FRMD8P1 isoform X2 [Scaptodrosophila lebanonensis]